MNVLEFDVCCHGLRVVRYGVRAVQDGRHRLLQLEHLVHVDEGLLNLPIDAPHKVERNAELEQQTVDQDKISDGGIPG